MPLGGAPPAFPVLANQVRQATCTMEQVQFVHHVSGLCLRPQGLRQTGCCNHVHFLDLVQHSLSAHLSQQGPVSVINRPTLRLQNPPSVSNNHPLGSAEQCLKSVS